MSAKEGHGDGFGMFGLKPPRKGSRWFQRRRRHGSRALRALSESLLRRLRRSRLSISWRRVGQKGHLPGDAEVRDLQRRCDASEVVSDDRKRHGLGECAAVP